MSFCSISGQHILALLFPFSFCPRLLVNYFPGPFLLLRLGYISYGSPRQAARMHGSALKYARPPRLLRFYLMGGMRPVS